MQNNNASMKTALRVLTAITDRMEPAPTDVAELHRLAPECPELSIDELATEVIHRALKIRGRQPPVIPFLRVKC
jgi:hypothetical protein